MVDYSAKIEAFAGAYRSGIYTKDDAIGAIMGLLSEAPDFRILWNEVPPLALSSRGSWSWSVG